MRQTMAKAAAMAVVVLAIVAAGSSRADAEVSMSFFYSNLSPHGSWHVSAQYGRVWTPAVYSPGWNPYLDGHWVYTEFGWTWVSDYPWGAIPYHYGTWYPDPVYGWAWVPGYVWAPSWVYFRTGPDYVGWAPVSPGYSVGVSVGFGTPVASSFVFVSSGDFLAPRVRACAYPESRTRLIVNNTRVVNNISVQNNVVVNRGPGLGWAERATRRSIHAVSADRVPHLTAGAFRRSEIAVSPQRARQGLRASEPEAGTRRYSGNLHGNGSGYAGAAARAQRQSVAPQSPGVGRYQNSSWSQHRGSAAGGVHATTVNRGPVRQSSSNIGTRMAMVSPRAQSASAGGRRSLQEMPTSSVSANRSGIAAAVAARGKAASPKSGQRGKAAAQKQPANASR